MKNLFDKIMNTEVDVLDNLPNDVLQDAEKIYKDELIPAIETAKNNLNILNQVVARDYSYDDNRTINNSNVNKYDLESLIRNSKIEMIRFVESLEYHIKELLRTRYNIKIKTTTFEINNIPDKEYDAILEQVENYDYKDFLRRVANEIGDYEKKSLENNLNIFVDNGFYAEKVKTFKTKVSFKNAVSIDANTWRNPVTYKINTWINSNDMETIFKTVNFFFQKYYERNRVSNYFSDWIIGSELDDHIDFSKTYSNFPNVSYKFYKNGTLDVIFDTREECQKFVSTFKINELKTLDELRGW